jgi:hypothetical protein
VQFKGPLKNKQGQCSCKLILQLQVRCMRLGLQISQLGYEGVNLGAITTTQRVVKTWIKTQMQVVGHVLARHETIFIE